MYIDAHEPLMAATAPTERSMPRVAITSVMPEGHQDDRCRAAQDVDRRRRTGSRPAR